MGCSHSGVVEGAVGSLGAQGGHVCTEGSLGALWYQWGHWGTAGRWGHIGVIGAQLDGGGDSGVSGAQ